MLSGMNAESQLQENIETLSDEHVADLTQEEKDLIGTVYRRIQPPDQILLRRASTTHACPAEKLDIPRILRCLTTWNIYEQNPSTKLEYETWIPAGSITLTVSAVKPAKKNVRSICRSLGNERGCRGNGRIAG